MKLNLRHEFDCSPERFWELFWDDEYNAKVSEGAAVERQLVREWEEGGKKCWRMRFVPDRELPKPLRKLMGTDKLVYEQENKLDQEAGEMHWDVIPAVLADKVTARGVMKIVPTERGCERIVDGEISVRVPMIGGKIEKTILQNVQESYDTTAVILRQMA